MALSHYVPISFEDDHDLWSRRPFSLESEWLGAPRLSHRNHQPWIVDRPARSYRSDLYPRSDNHHDLYPRTAHLYTHQPSLSTSLATVTPPPSPVVANRDLDREIDHMKNNMSRMYHDMLTLIPAKAIPSDIHMSEDLRMDNPIVTDHVSGQKKFRLEFDVRQFRPEEISLTTSDNILTVHARHEDKTEGKSAFREYKRQYTIPKTVSPEALTSKLSHDGILSIEAPVHLGDTMIPIQHH